MKRHRFRALQQRRALAALRRAADDLVLAQVIATHAIVEQVRAQLQERYPDAVEIRVRVGSGGAIDAQVTRAPVGGA